MLNISENSTTIIEAPKCSLDRIIWHALNTRQAAFARIEGTARKFEDAIGPLAGFDGDAEEGYRDLARLAGKAGVVGLFLQERFKPRNGWRVTGEGPLIEMVRQKKGDLAQDVKTKIITLGDEHSSDMQALTALAKPGPFGPRTHKLGNFFGIYEDGKLAAMAGERMKVPGFTEISAVCTHPDHTGKGYAAAVMYKIIEGIEARGETAMLHSRADNDRAVALYERLGFRTMKSGYFAAITPG